MAATLVSLETRLKNFLVDSSSVNFPAAQLDEGLRLALGEYNLMLGFQGVTAVTVSGLDGAAVTTLPGGHESALVVGAAGYIAAGRTLDRAESFDLGQTVPAELKDWAKERLVEFRKMVSQYRSDLNKDLETARKADLHAAAAPPYTSDDSGLPGWPVDARDGEPL